MKKRLICLLLSFAIVLPTIFTSALATSDLTDCGGNSQKCPSAVFTDVPRYGNWAHSGIDFVLHRKLFAGTGAKSFSPDVAMTRAMLVTVLWRYEGSPSGYFCTFSDVNRTSGSWYFSAVAWAAKNGIVSGIGNNKFDPDGIVSREQLSSILFRYTEFKELKTTKRAELSKFPDSSRVHSWALAAVQWAVAENIISGSTVKGETYLMPRNSATRAQVAAILMRYIKGIVEK